MQSNVETVSKTADHILSMENRHRLTITGVNDVVCFDEKSVLLYTVMGKLTIKGSGLKINKLQVGSETGDLVVEGEISSLDYGSSKAPVSRNQSTFAKLFR